MLIRTALLLASIALLLSGCSSMMLTGSSSAGARGAGDTGEQRSAERADDAAIAARVRARLGEDPAVAAAGLAVRSDDGRVTLSGSVGSYAIRNQAYRLARQAEGVRAVINQIRVEQ